MRWPWKKNGPEPEPDPDTAAELAAAKERLAKAQNEIARPLQRIQQRNHVTELVRAIIEGTDNRGRRRTAG